MFVRQKKKGANLMNPAPIAMLQIANFPENWTLFIDELVVFNAMIDGVARENSVSGVRMIVSNAVRSFASFHMRADIGAGKRSQHAFAARMLFRERSNIVELAIDSQKKRFFFDFDALKF